MTPMIAALKFAGFLGLTLALMPVQFMLVRTSPSLARALPHWYHRTLARLLGFHISVEGSPPGKRAALVVANHVSWIDIVALSAAAPVSFIAKKEVAGWPLFGLMAKLQRTVFVDRDSRHQTDRLRNQMTARLEAGDVLVLFPEGTSHDGLNVLDFKSAFFSAADRDGLEVVPVAIGYTHVLNLPMTRRQRPRFAWYGDMDLVSHLWEALKSTPISITIKFHDPTTLAVAGGRKPLARLTETLLQDSIARLVSGR
jgi:lyso-ornithine lipid O-acyltransferase